MISTMVLIIFLLIIFLITAVISRAIFRKQQIIGRPPVPVIYFLLAKALVLVNLIFLLLKGLNIDVKPLFVPGAIINIIALALLIIGTVILILSSIKLNKDLVFGLSSSETHQLQTNGIFSISRHPFYLGFLFILFSSCLLTPHFLNILAFIGAWIIHHFIMIKEEQFLSSEYGDAYRNYTNKVNRYITLNQGRKKR
jgi:protein-S-isoprenylcysteine O-methyltransferase Ste14